MSVRPACRTVAAPRSRVWRVLADPERLATCLAPGAGLLRADTAWPTTGSVMVARVGQAAPGGQGPPLLLTVLSCDEPVRLHLLVGRWPREEVVRVDLRGQGARTAVVVERTPTGVRLRSDRVRHLQDLGGLARLEEACAHLPVTWRPGPGARPARALSRWA